MNVILLDDADTIDARHVAQTLAAVRERLAALGLGDRGVSRCVREVERLLRVSAATAGVCPRCLDVLDDEDAHSDAPGVCLLCSMGVRRAAAVRQLALGEVIEVEGG